MLFLQDDFLVETDARQRELFEKHDVGPIQTEVTVLVEKIRSLLLGGFARHDIPERHKFFIGKYRTDSAQRMVEMHTAD